PDLPSSLRPCPRRNAASEVAARSSRAWARCWPASVMAARKLASACCFALARSLASRAIIHPCRIGALVSGREGVDLDSFNRFGYYLGAAFQIQDDVLNLEGDRGKYGKEIGGDLLEGKRTLILRARTARLPVPGRPSPTTRRRASRCRDGRLLRRGDAPPVPGRPESDAESRAHGPRGPREARLPSSGRSSPASRRLTSRTPWVDRGPTGGPRPARGRRGPDAHGRVRDVRGAHRDRDVSVTELRTSPSRTRCGTDWRRSRPSSASTSCRSRTCRRRT